MAKRRQARVEGLRPEMDNRERIQVSPAHAKAR